jgi:hypothetical protein
LFCNFKTVLNISPFTINQNYSDLMSGDSSLVLTEMMMALVVQNADTVWSEYLVSNLKEKIYE